MDISCRAGLSGINGIRYGSNLGFDWGCPFKMVLYPKVLLAVLVSYATAQFVPAPTDLITKKGHAGIDVRYKEVPPGICEQDPSVKSYSGYADVGEDEHIFW